MADIEIETGMPSTAFEGIMLGAQAARDSAAGHDTSAADHATDAGASALTASLSASAAVAANGRMFATIALGLGATAEGDFFTVVGDGTSTYAILYCKTGGAAVEQARYASKAAYEGTSGAALIGYGPRTVGDKLGESISLLDDMTVAERTSVLLRTEVYDVTNAVNAAFLKAAASGRSVYVPNGTYSVTNLLFGNQIRNGSNSPAGLIGESSLGVIFKARPGTTGTLLQSWTAARRRYESFTLDCAGLDLQAWDCDWLRSVPGESAPSTACIISDIRVQGSDADVVVSLNDLNDSYPYMLVIQGMRADQTCLRMIQSGGQLGLDSCQWYVGSALIGCQSGVLHNCVGTGLCMAFGSDNNVRWTSGQLYGNTSRRALIWSQTFNGADSGIFGLIIEATYLLGTNLDEDGCYLDVKLFSKIRFEACCFLGGRLPLFGPNTRAGSQTTSLVEVVGGGSRPTSAGNEVIFNDVGNVVSISDHFISGTTSLAVDKVWSGTFAPMLDTPGVTPAYDAQIGEWERRGNRVRFTIVLQPHMSAASGPMIIGGLPFPNRSTQRTAVPVGYASSDYPNVRAAIVGRSTQIVLYAGDGSPMNVPGGQTHIEISGTYECVA